jgi:hypothetical protein
MVSLDRGGATGIRTPDLLNAIQTLSQLSYSPTPDGEYIAPRLAVRAIASRAGLKRARPTGSAAAP